MTNEHVEILLVDDCSADIELTIHVLRENKLGKHIHVVEDGNEALEFVFCRGAYEGRSSREQPSLILLDLKLPKVDGLEVLKAIRSDGRTKAIPVVVFTSSKEQKDLIAGYRLGASAYIQKPVDFEQFRLTIKEIGRFWLVSNQPPPPEVFAV